MTLLAIWRRTDEPRHDVVELKQTDLGWLLNGAAVYLSDAGPHGWTTLCNWPKIG